MSPPAAPIPKNIFLNQPSFGKRLDCRIDKPLSVKARLKKILIEVDSEITQISVLLIPEHLDRERRLRGARAPACQERPEERAVTREPCTVPSRTALPVCVSTAVAADRALPVTVGRLTSLAHLHSRVRPVA